MGSASREALAEARSALEAGVSEGSGAQLLSAASQIAANTALASALGDAAAPAAGKAQLVERLFGDLSADARRVLVAATAARWSTVDEFVDGVEELGLRAQGLNGTELADELLAAADVIDGSHELQLSLGSKLVEADGKAALVRALFADKLSEAALAAVTHLASNARGRRIDASLREAARVVADQAGSELATVTVAAALSAEQHGRLSALLERTVGRTVKLSTVIDPELIGGIRIQVADDVIDGSVRARLEDLRQQLAA